MFKVTEVLTTNILYVLFPEIEITEVPGPVIVKFAEIPGRSEVSVIVPVSEESNTISSIEGFVLASMIAQRNVPEEASSAILFTVTDCAKISSEKEKRINRTRKYLVFKKTVKQVFMKLWKYKPTKI